jgi:hypothetical protein
VSDPFSGYESRKGKVVVTSDPRLLVDPAGGNVGMRIDLHEFPNALSWWSQGCDSRHSFGYLLVKPFRYEQRRSRRNPSSWLGSGAGLADKHLQITILKFENTVMRQSLRGEGKLKCLSTDIARADLGDIEPIEQYIGTSLPNA